MVIDYHTKKTIFGKFYLIIDYHLLVIDYYIEKKFFKKFCDHLLLLDIINYHWQLQLILHFLDLIFENKSLYILAKSSFKNNFSFKGLELWLQKKLSMYIKIGFVRPNMGRVRTFTKCALKWLGIVVVPRKSFSSFV